MVSKYRIVETTYGKRFGQVGYQPSAWLLERQVFLVQKRKLFGLGWTEIDYFYTLQDATDSVLRLMGVHEDQILVKNLKAREDKVVGEWS